MIKGIVRGVRPIIIVGNVAGIWHMRFLVVMCKSIVCDVILLVLLTLNPLFNVSVQGDSVFFLLNSILLGHAKLRSHHFQHVSHQVNHQNSLLGLQRFRL